MEKDLSILLVEDDPNLGMLLAEFLNAKGHSCTLQTDGQKGYDAFVDGHWDFIIMDVMMPVKDGFTLAEEIRGIDKKVPILFLTAKSLKEDTLKGFNVGADDYMTKPFSMEELLARITAIMRRVPEKHKEDQSEYEIGKYVFDFNQRKLIIGDEEHKLTTKENELLKLLCKNRNDILERNNALKAVWGDDNYFNGRSMDVYIAKLRKYLKGDPDVEIVNVHGRGFKLFIKQ